MKVISSEFIKSAANASHYPDHNYPEIAFAGRSNVGKSSLINTLINRKRLVKTSSTPGRTQLINFFLINKLFSFVDLPGYGYAKVPLSVKKQWGPMIEKYLSNRNILHGVVLIVDIRRTPGESEINFIDWLNNYSINTILVVTKSDKLSKTKRAAQIIKIGSALNINPDALICFSIKSKMGRDILWKAIDRLLQNTNLSNFCVRK